MKKPYATADNPKGYLSHCKTIRFGGQKVTFRAAKGYLLHNPKRALGMQAMRHSLASEVKQ